MSSFDRFKQLNQTRATSQEHTNANFIFKGYPSTTITSDLDESAQLPACVVNQQEKDVAYIYTTLDNALDVGTSWSAKGLHWLIVEEIIVIHNVQWHKYLAYLCNINLNGLWGMFIGPEKTYINVQSKFHSEIVSQQKPVFVFPSGKYLTTVNNQTLIDTLERVLGQESIDINDKIVLNGRPWLIQEYDDISTEGITYFSLAPTTLSKTADDGQEGASFILKAQRDVPDIVVDPTTDEENVTWISYNQAITIETTDALFEADVEVIIDDLTETSVTFRLPFGVSQATVTTGLGTFVYKIEE